MSNIINFIFSEQNFYIFLVGTSNYIPLGVFNKELLLNIIVKLILFYKQYKMGGPNRIAGEDAKYIYIKTVGGELV